MSLPSNATDGSFQNLIYKSFGFSNLETVLYSLPMYGVSAVAVVCSAITVRYYPRMRFPIALFVQAICVFVLLFAGVSPAGKWAKWGVWTLCLVYAIASFVMAWPMISVNVAGRTKKSFFGGSSLLSYCVGNIVGSQIFLPSDAPKYLRGLTACSVILIVSMCVTGYWWYHYWRQNKKRDAEDLRDGVTVEQRDAQARLNGELDMTDIQVSWVWCSLTSRIASSDTCTRQGYVWLSSGKQLS